jgi:hypothetical protein
METAFFIITLFLAGALADLFWAYYLLNMSLVESTAGLRKYRRRAAWWSVALGMGSWLMVDGMMANKWLVSFWLIGLWCGTYYAYPIKQFFMDSRDGLCQ